MEAVYTDLETNQAIVNSANDLYNPPVEEPRAIVRLRIIKRWDKDTWESLQIENYLHHKNLHAFWTFRASKAYLSGVDATLVKEPYWHYQVALDVEGETKASGGGSRPPGRRPDVSQGLARQIPLRGRRRHNAGKYQSLGRRGWKGQSQRPPKLLHLGHEAGRRLRRPEPLLLNP